MARRPDPTARQRILDAATRLFDTYGVHAVGLQQVIDELGCGKNLLYREFATKDELVVAYLGRCRDAWTAMIEAATAPFPDDPAAQLVAIVRTTVEHATAPGYRGCPVHNTHAEFPDAAHPVHPVAVRHFTVVQDLLLDLAERAGAADPKALADRLALIIDGANTNGAALGNRGSAAAAVAFAEDVVRAAVS
ncbi:TetR/AcrR family transcriptional regulator [Dactylosporangium sp. McL0621]|uniref:TetR/AcrR family transcriptional regulator n=1 Tax=Dactylosporangium sp. McL0621 TaxID=3415678 RepID=UPI003CF85176